MKAGQLASPHPVVRWNTPASEAARLVADPQVRAALVLDDSGRFRGVLSDTRLLRLLLPPYVDGDRAMAAVLDEQAAGALWRRLEGRTAADLIAGEDEELPAIEADATLIEVASLMVRTRSSLVAVREEERVIGAITIVALLEQLLLR